MIDHINGAKVQSMNIIPYDYLRTLVNGIKKSNIKITLATGVIDVFHFGHLSYLEYAASFGGIFIVGLDGDERVKSLKGPSRPINTQYHRSRVVGALKFVDYVCVYPDIKKFLDIVRPDTWVKGADYTISTLNKEERDIVSDNGGNIEFSPFVDGLSTTSIINKL